MMLITFEAPTCIYFGPQVPDGVLPDSGAGLLVIDPAVRNHPATTDVLERLTGRTFTTWSGVEPNPSWASVQAATAAAKGTRVHWVMAIGGGSAIDTGKVLAARLLPLSPLPLVAVPTTAGTGSEVSPHAIITGDDHRKQVLYDPAFRSRAAGLDPRFVLSAPPGVRLAAGLDALTHAVESFLSRRANPISRALSLAAVRASVGSLPPIVAGDADLETSSSMQVAAAMAGLAMASAGVGVCHALGHPLTRLYGAVHGLGVSALLAAAIDLQRDAVPGADQLDAAFNGDAASAVRQLRRTLGAPTARDLGLAAANAADLASLREEALTNPAVRDSHLRVDAMFLDSLIARACEEETICF